MMREMIPERKSYFQDSVHTHIHLEVMDYAFQFFINLEATKHKQTWASIRFSVKWNIGLVSIVPLDILKARSTTHRPFVLCHYFLRCRFRIGHIPFHAVPFFVFLYLVFVYTDSHIILNLKKLTISTLVYLVLRNSPGGTSFL